MKTLLFLSALLVLSTDLISQHMITGLVYDSQTNEPIVGAHVLVSGTQSGTITNANGQFNLEFRGTVDSVEFSFVGYEKQRLDYTSGKISVGLVASANNLEQVLVTANREAVLRSEAPVAISKLSPQVISDTKPILLTELLNKVPGVIMLNYNNEQHAMSIRQPMGTSAYFLYLEDGFPLRPMGVFNHNALIEMNIFSISTLEVIKGPASSLYGPEAVGGAVNFITHRGTATPTAKLGLQADQWGYRRIQYAAGGTVGKRLGIYISGFEARQSDAWQANSDYAKSSISLRLDYSLTDKTTLTATFSGNEYNSDMAGSVDSLAFYRREYSSTTDFTYRKVHAQRARFSIAHTWNKANETSFTFGYRDNYIEQVPNYALRWTTGNSTATVERNRNTFYSKVAQVQHRVNFNFLAGKLLTGGVVDMSPANYWAYRIDLAAQLRSDGKSVEKYSIVAERPDVFLSNYDAYLKNYAAYSQFEMNPLERLKVTFGVRYDKITFDYENYLDHTTGTKSFDQFTPKIGATFELLKDKGVYANYSEGFSPPGLTAIFRKRSNATPGNEFYYNLEPARFRNFEVGGWSAFFQNKVYVDIAAYQMIGRNELVSIRQPDNSIDQQSAGKTLHRGIEYGVTYKPNDEWNLRFGGTNARHRFVQFDLSNRSTDEFKNVNGRIIPQSPKWIANAEAVYKPRYVHGLRVSLEWQRISSWYQDQVNNVRYDDKGTFGLKGVSYLNLRVGYDWKGIEVFSNILNLTDELYAHSATRGNSENDRTTFTPAAPRTLVFGVEYSFKRKNKRSL